MEDWKELEGAILRDLAQLRRSSVPKKICLGVAPRNGLNGNSELDNMKTSSGYQVKKFAANFERQTTQTLQTTQIPQRKNSKVDETKKVFIQPQGEGGNETSKKRVMLGGLTNSNFQQSVPNIPSPRLEQQEGLAVSTSTSPPLTRNNMPGRKYGSSVETSTSEAIPPQRRATLVSTPTNYIRSPPMFSVSKFQTTSSFIPQTNSDVISPGRRKNFGSSVLSPPVSPKKLISSDDINLNTVTTDSSELNSQQKTITSKPGLWHLLPVVVEKELKGKIHYYGHTEDIGRMKPKKLSTETKKQLQMSLQNSVSSRKNSFGSSEEFHFQHVEDKSSQVPSLPMESIRSAHERFSSFSAPSTPTAHHMSVPLALSIAGFNVNQVPNLLLPSIQMNQDTVESKESQNFYLEEGGENKFKENNKPQDFIEEENQVQNHLQEKSQCENQLQEKENQNQDMNNCEDQVAEEKHQDELLSASQLEIQDENQYEDHCKVLVDVPHAIQHEVQPEDVQLEIQDENQYTGQKEMQQEDTLQNLKEHQETQEVNLQDKDQYIIKHQQEMQGEGPHENLTQNLVQAEDERYKNEQKQERWERNQKDETSANEKNSLNTKHNLECLNEPQKEQGDNFVEKKETDIVQENTTELQSNKDSRLPTGVISPREIDVDNQELNDMKHIQKSYVLVPRLSDLSLLSSSLSSTPPLPPPPPLRVLTPPPPPAPLLGNTPTKKNSHRKRRSGTKKKHKKERKRQEDTATTNLDLSTVPLQKPVPSVTSQILLSARMAERELILEHSNINEQNVMPKKEIIKGSFARIIVDYPCTPGTEQTQLSLKKGDIVKFLDTDKNGLGWAKGEFKGKRGWFPYVYMEPYDGEPTQVDTQTSSTWVEERNCENNLPSELQTNQSQAVEPESTNAISSAQETLQQPQTKGSHVKKKKKTKKPLPVFTHCQIPEKGELVLAQSSYHPEGRLTSDLIEFDKGDVMSFLEIDPNGLGWAKVEKAGGERGWFPFEFVSPIPDPLPPRKTSTNSRLGPSFTSPQRNTRLKIGAGRMTDPDAQTITNESPLCEDLNAELNSGETKLSDSGRKMTSTLGTTWTTYSNQKRLGFFSRGCLMKVLKAYEAQSESELNVAKGDILPFLDMHSEWIKTQKGHSRGWVPINHVLVLSEPIIPSYPPPSLPVESDASAVNVNVNPNVTSPTSGSSRSSSPILLRSHSKTSSATKVLFSAAALLSSPSTSTAARALSPLRLRLNQPENCTSTLTDRKLSIPSSGWSRSNKNTASTVISLNDYFPPPASQIIVPQPGDRVQAIADFRQKPISTEGLLSFHKGAIILLMERDSGGSGWAKGEVHLVNGDRSEHRLRGWFPSSFVQMLPEPSVPKFPVIPEIGTPLRSPKKQPTEDEEQTRRKTVVNRTRYNYRVYVENELEDLSSLTVDLNQKVEQDALKPLNQIAWNLQMEATKELQRSKVRLEAATMHLKKAVVLDWMDIIEEWEDDTAETKELLYDWLALSTNVKCINQLDNEEYQKEANELLTKAISSRKGKRKSMSTTNGLSTNVKSEMLNPIPTLEMLPKTSSGMMGSLRLGKTRRTRAKTNISSPGAAGLIGMFNKPGDTRDSKPESRESFDDKLKIRLNRTLSVTPKLENSIFTTSTKGPRLSKSSNYLRAISPRSKNRSATLADSDVVKTKKLSKEKQKEIQREKAKQREKEKLKEKEKKDKRKEQGNSKFTGLKECKFHPEKIENHDIICEKKQKEAAKEKDDQLISTSNIESNYNQEPSLPTVNSLVSSSTSYFTSPSVDSTFLSESSVDPNQCPREDEFNDTFTNQTMEPSEVARKPGEDPLQCLEHDESETKSKINRRIDVDIDEETNSEELANENLRHMALFTHDSSSTSSSSHSGSPYETPLPSPSRSPSSSDGVLSSSSKSSRPSSVILPSNFGIINTLLASKQGEEAEVGTYKESPRSPTCKPPDLPQTEQTSLKKTKSTLAMLFQRISQMRSP